MPFYGFAITYLWLLLLFQFSIHSDIHTANTYINYEFAVALDMRLYLIKIRWIGCIFNERPYSIGHHQPNQLTNFLIIVIYLAVSFTQTSNKNVKTNGKCARHFDSEVSCVRARSPHLTQIFVAAAFLLLFQTESKTNSGVCVTCIDKGKNYLTNKQINKFD